MKKIRLRKKKEITVYSVLPDCLNCGKPFATDDKFCSYCGQKNVEKLNFGSFIGQVVSGMFSYDSRFWNTFIPLLLKPGKVSKDFIDGKRKRYVNPFQMYLNVSIIFFLILGLSNKMDNPVNLPDTVQIPAVALDSLIPKDVKEEFFKNIDTVDQKIITSFSEGFALSEILKDSAYQYKIHQNKIKTLTLLDKVQDFNAFQDENPTVAISSTALTKLGYPINFWNTFYFELVQRIKTNSEQIKSDNGNSVVKKIVSNLSIGLFVFLPFFTMAFKLFYFRKRMNYMEHLVFVFHTQTVFFLLMTIYILMGFFSNYESLGVFLLLFLIYLYLALLKFYQQGWFKTFVKFILLNLVYMQIGGVVLFFISVISFMFN